MTTPNLRQEPRTAALVGVALCGVLMGGLIGATTGAINGLLVPRWTDIGPEWDDGWLGLQDHLGEGLVTGLVIGMVLSVAWITGAGIITLGDASFRFLIKHLAGVAAGIILFWFLGGCTGLALLALSARLVGSSRMMTPSQALGYAWATGSAWGLQSGSLFWLVLGLVVLYVNWRHRAGLAGTATPFPPSRSEPE